MVVDTEYYDALAVAPTATELEIKKAYRKMAIKLHPDKNPDDPSASEKFQKIGEAYQVLSDPQLRAAYDRDGKESAKPTEGFADPAEFFGMIFGGEAFVDWIGEISLMKDLTRSMELSERMEKEDEHAAGKEAQEAVRDEARSNVAAAADVDAVTAGVAGVSVEDESDAKAHETPAADTAKDAAPATPAAAAAAAAAATAAAPSTDAAAPSYAQSRPAGVPMRPAIMATSEEEARLDAAGVTEQEKELRAKEKKKGLSKEQREELLAYERERERVRQERVDTLARKLTDRMSVWTETDKGGDVTKAFRDKTKLEVENLKMESFGLEILHAVGAVYLSKGGNYLKSQKFFGIGGFFSRLRDKGKMAQDIWGTFSTAIDAQMAMEEMGRAEQEGGDGWTDEAKAEHERRVTGKILAAAWRGSKFEIQSVLRDVCDRVLGDKHVRLEKRVERAQALVLMGEILRDASRTKEEENENMVFEQLMADAAKKKEEEKKKRKEKKAEADDGKGHFGFGSKGEKSAKEVKETPA